MINHYHHSLPSQVLYISLLLITLVAITFQKSINFSGTIMKKYIDTFYPLKVWYSTLLIAPIIWILLFPIDKLHSFDFFILGLIIGASLVFTLPTFLLFWLAFVLVYRWELHTNSKKLVLSFIVILFVYVTFYLIDNNFIFDSKVLPLPICYCFVAIVFIYLFSMEQIIEE
jgi:hypothetical protein